jgi:transcriptional regulator with XRE-family HTH domain
MEKFGHRLKSLRQKAKQTQDEVAAAVKTNSGTVSRWERGLGMPHADQIIALAKHFSVSTDHLLLGQPHEEHVKSLEFHKFLATEYGRIALARGWTGMLLSWQYPFPPTVHVYKNLVHALLLEDEERKQRQ